ncbi:hypothetical protein U0070_003262, partial [Myodes glareolus]
MCMYTVKLQDTEFAVESLSPGLNVNSKLGLHSKPSLHVVLDPVARAPHEETVSFTCKSIDFSPQNITVNSPHHGDQQQPSDVGNLIYISVELVNKDGTYNWTSWVLVNTSVHEEDLVLTCQVEHDGLAPVLKSHTVVVHAQQKGQGTSTVS